MNKKVYVRTGFCRKVIFVFTAALAFTSSNNILGQNPTPNIDSAVKKSDKETDVGPEKSHLLVKSQSKIKVLFDEKAPGVLIIESNGEKIRVDALKKVVEQISVDSSQENTGKITDQHETDKVEESSETQDENPYDFDEGEEPYEYRLINIPTPKKVPRGTWNLSFSHRFSQPIHPISESGKNLLGFDSFSVSSFGVSYGITDKFYVTASRSPLCQIGLCRTIEVGFGYNWIAQDKESPIALTTYASIEGNDNFTEEYSYNLQAMVSSRIGKRIYLFFSPAIHLNANGQGHFNPRPDQFFPPATVANTFRLPTNGASFGFGTSVMITPNVLATFDFTPRTGFKLGRVDPIFDNNFNVIGFQSISYPSIGFGIQRNIGRHAFALTFSNTQTTTTSRYNSSNLVFSPKKLVIGFNLFRRF